MDDKIIFTDEHDQDKAISGTIISRSDDFITIKKNDRIIEISKARIIKIERDSDGY